MDIKQVFDRYRRLLELYNPCIGRVLKTDCFNEASGDFRDLWGILDPARTTYLEIDSDTIGRARAAHPEGDYQQGDIRSLPFDDMTFSAVFDLSTIDHIPPGDVRGVLSEYNRVLKLNGKLVLVAWCAPERKEDPVDWDGPQYFLYEPDILEGLGGFAVFHREEIHRADEVYLVNLLARKT